MARSEGVSLSDADAPFEGDRASDSSRRWRFIGRAAALVAPVTDWSSWAGEVARLVVEEMGDAAAVVIHPAVVTQPIVASGHVRPDRQDIVAGLLNEARNTDLMELIAAVGAAGERVVTSPESVDNAWFQSAYARYAAAVGASVIALVPLRRSSRLIGFLACARETGSTPYSADDLAAVAAAADTVALLVDLAAARHAERAANSRYSTVFDTAPIGMSVIGSDGRVQTINPAGQHIVGRAPEDVVGRSWEDFSDPAELTDDRAALEDILAGNNQVRAARLVRPDGSRRWVRSALTLVRDAAGQPESIHASFVDVTEQFEAEEEAVRFVALAHTSPDLVAIAALDETGLYLNPAGRALTGIDPDADLSHLRIDDFLPSGDPASMSEIATVRRGKQWEGRSSIVHRPSNTVIPVWASSQVIHDPRTGDPIALATIRRDLRELLNAQLEAERLAEQRSFLLRSLLEAERNEQLRIANELHDDSVQFLAAGQLRVRLLSAQLANGDIDAAQASVHAVGDLVLTALSRLRDILADLAPPEPFTAQMEAGLTTAAEQLFGGTGTRVDVIGTMSDAPQHVGYVLHRVGREALTNARRHARASHVTVVFRSEPAAWTLTVSDNGVGMPDNPPTRPGHVGMQAMTSRVEALGGVCSVKRRPEGGTVVEVVVPRPGYPLPPSEP